MATQKRGSEQAQVLLSSTSPRAYAATRHPTFRISYCKKMCETSAATEPSLCPWAPRHGLACQISDNTLTPIKRCDGGHDSAADRDGPCPFLFNPFRSIPGSGAPITTATYSTRPPSQRPPTRAHTPRIPLARGAIHHLPGRRRSLFVAAGSVRGRWTRRRSSTWAPL